MRDLKTIITLAKNNDDEALVEIIEMFEPMIRKFDKQMGFDEDFKSDMVEFLIRIIRTVDFSRMCIYSSGALVNYINKSLKNQFILLSKARGRLRTNEAHYDQEHVEEWLGIDYSAEYIVENIVTMEYLKSILSEREYSCLKLMVLEGHSSTEAARILGIARQTVNEAKIRALKKIKVLIK